jgi:hypothetical protein
MISADRRRKNRGNTGGMDQRCFVSLVFHAARYRSPVVHTTGRIFHAFYEKKG